MRIGVRWLFAVHRYAGIALCLLMLMWCLSGIVMMYVPYPSLPEPARLAGLAPLDWRKCCVLPGGPSSDFSVEMMHGRLLLRGGGVPIDLSTGKRIAAVSQADARAIAAGFARGNSIAAGQLAFETIEKDQWTVSGEFRPDRPLYRMSLDDAAGTQIYISGTSGRVVQRVTAAQRFWNYLGAVPHWLYFTQLRAQPALWTQTVIWTSLAGSFLVALGLYLGIRQSWLARRTGRWSPYRDFTLWHHLPGLVFGLFLLSWIVSGFLSMNPWGLLEGDSGEAEAAALNGAPVPLAEVGRALHAISQAPVDATIVSLASAPLDGHLYFVATRKDGRRLRWDAAGHPALLDGGRDRRHRARDGARCCYASDASCRGRRLLLRPWRRGAGPAGLAVDRARWRSLLRRSGLRHAGGQARQRGSLLSLAVPGPASA